MVVLPSLDEGFGLPALEAMTVGVPVVVSNRGALPEVVGNAGTLVDPEDENAIEASMARILDDRQYADGTVARGLIQAQAYNWSKSARILLAAYENAVRQRRGL
jgi:glycosyltransferase involved in cell wall biosynthesis